MFQGDSDEERRINVGKISTEVIKNTIKFFLNKNFIFL